MLCLAACSSSATMEKADNKLIEDSVNEASDTGTGEFDVASVTTDSTLSEMRGGFVSAGGLLINFSLQSFTAINGEVQPQSVLNLNSNGLNGVLPGTLQQLLQSGNGNHAAVPASAVPINVLTVVQNTSNNQVIQNQNILDITVNNLAAFRAQQLAFNQRFAAGLSR